MGVRHRPRLRGSSKVSLTDVPRTLATLLPFWWSRVLFAGKSSSPVQAPPRESATAARLAFATLIVLAAILFFVQLCRTPARTARAALRRDSPTNVERRQLDRAGFARPTLSRQAAAVVLVGDSQLLPFWRSRLGGALGSRSRRLADGLV